MTNTLAEQFKTLADQFAAERDTLYVDFDPQATEDQEGDIGIITFRDGSRFFNNAATGETWTTSSWWARFAACRPT